MCEDRFRPSPSTPSSTVVTPSSSSPTRRQWSPFPYCCHNRPQPSGLRQIYAFWRLPEFLGWGPFLLLQSRISSSGLCLLCLWLSPAGKGSLLFRTCVRRDQAHLANPTFSGFDFSHLQRPLCQFWQPPSLSIRTGTPLESTILLTTGEINGLYPSGLLVGINIYFKKRSYM